VRVRVCTATSSFNQKRSKNQCPGNIHLVYLSFVQNSGSSIPNLSLSSSHYGSAWPKINPNKAQISLKGRRTGFIGQLLSWTNYPKNEWHCKIIDEFGGAWRRVQTLEQIFLNETRKHTRWPESRSLWWSRNNFRSKHWDLVDAPPYINTSDAATLCAENLLTLYCHRWLW